MIPDFSKNPLSWVFYLCPPSKECATYDDVLPVIAQGIMPCRRKPDHLSTSISASLQQKWNALKLERLRVPDPQASVSQAHPGLSHGFCTRSLRGADGNLPIFHPCSAAWLPLQSGGVATPERGGATICREPHKQYIATQSEAT